VTEEVFPGIYRISVPIPRSPLKATNVYAIRGSERNLLIDTGQNRSESLETLKNGLDEIAIDMRVTDIFLTHMHADHSGLLPYVKSNDSIIYASAEAAERVNYMLTAENPMERLFQAACRNGFSASEARSAIERHPGSYGTAHQALEFQTLTEGDEFVVGEYRFICMETPGHTQGHLCLYEPTKKLLFSGDHVLGDISPNITHYIGDGDPLAEFIASLQKIAKLSVQTVLPGHRRIFNDCHGRIHELLQHHQQRAEEAFAILAEGALTGYEVASRMTWDMVYRSWSDVAPPQKYFATGEALAHLRYLEKQGRISHSLEQDQVFYHWLK
jgi:glyoxylase-like metal-dependent hydrolase (beta-lactamase superfamily II)